MSGGGKDNTPPQLDSTKTVEPPNGTVGFNAKQIVIPFDEYITLKNADKEILITPFLDAKPDIYAKGKKLIIDFKSPLKDQTTYIINFGKSITDITEGNPLVNYKYVFSTGDYIDSLTYSAVVYDAFRKTPVKDSYVMLYETKDDSTVINQKPNYFGITDMTGKCSIANIASGTYKVVTFKEDNGDYKWNPKTEAIGFMERTFDANKDTIVDTLVLFMDHPNELKLNAVKISGNRKVQMIFNKAIPNQDLVADSILSQVADPSLILLSHTKDTLTFFLRTDLVKGEKYAFGIEGVKPQKEMVPLIQDTSLPFKTNAALGLKPMEDIKFNFSQPVSNIDDSKVILLSENKPISFEVIPSGPTEVIIAAPLVGGENYEVSLFPGFVSSYSGLTNDSIKAFVNKKEEKDFGNLITSLKLPKGTYIIELMQEGKVISRETANASEFSRTYTNLTPGKYAIRLIFDENNNGYWDTGNYFEHLFPERVEYYDGTIEIKKGWDVEVTWEIKQ